MRRSTGLSLESIGSTPSSAIDDSRPSFEGQGDSASTGSTGSIVTNLRGPPVAHGLRAVGDALTVREVATLLKVSTATVYSMVERGELAHFRVRNAIRVHRSAVERFSRGAP